MRCPEALRIAAALAVCVAFGAFAESDGVRGEIAARLQAQIPSVAPADYALGPGAFDPDLRAQIEANKGAGAAAVQRGAALWKRKFRDGRSLGSCFPNGGRRVAGRYPQYDPRLKRVVTLEMAVNQCLKAHKEPIIEGADTAPMAEIAAYLRSLSVGQKILVRVPAAAAPMLEQGRRLFYSRLGQYNFACASCHVQGAGKRFDDYTLTPAIGQAAQWPFIRDGQAVTLQAQMRYCLEERMGAAAFAAGSEELNDLEYFLTSLSNGYALRPNSWRPSRAQ